MRIVEWAKEIYNKYMGNHIEHLLLPEFVEEERRYRIVFGGNVQGVGFRYEVWRIAEKLKVTGFAQNLANGNVLVEAQGNRDKLLYLIEYMSKLPRIYIDKVEIEEIEMQEEEEFLPIYNK